MWVHDLGAQVGVGKTKRNVVGYHGANEVGLAVGDDDVAPVVPHHISVELGRVSFVAPELPTDAYCHSLELASRRARVGKFPWQPQQAV